MTNKGPARMKYDRQIFYQGQYVEIYPNGNIYFSYNPEIGNAIPSNVFHRTVCRIIIPNLDNIMTNSIRRQIYKDCKSDFHIIANGIKEGWDGNNIVGIYTDEAKNAIERIETYLFNKSYL